MDPSSSPRCTTTGSVAAGSRGTALVLGGGVIGCACAYYLARDGWQVRLLEQDVFGGACSRGNCGFICPSHVLPMARPGAVGHTLKVLMGRDSPIAIKPRAALGAWRWLYQFWRNCQHEPMLRAAVARQALLNCSMQLYRELLRDEAIDCEWLDEGLLFVFHQQREFEQYAATDALLQERFGLAAERLPREQLLQREPALLPKIAGGWHYACDAELRPDRLLAGWRQAVERLGVEILEQTSIEPLRRQHRRLAPVETSRGPQQADLVVLATGARSPLLCRKLPFRLPILPAKGYSMTMPTPAGGPRIPMILEDYHVGVTPMRSGYRLGSTFEIAGYDTTVNPARLALLRRAAEQSLRHPHAEPVHETWYGWRPMTCDGIPCLGRAPGVDNLLLATGHGMLGMSMAPGTGRLIADLAGDREPLLDPLPFEAARFG